MAFFAGLQAAQSLQGVLGLAMELVKEILQARKDVRDLPKSVVELLDVVERLKNVLRIIETAKIQDEEDFVKLQLQKVTAELLRASEKVNELQNKQPDQRSDALKTLIAVFKQGAAKQQKNIKAIREAIEREYGELLKALNVETHSMVKGIGPLLRGLLDQSSRASPTIPVEEPPIITQLESLAFECDDNGSYNVSFRIAKNIGDVFNLPGEENRIRTANDNREEGERRRSAKEGGYVVENNTMVKFEIRADEAFLYVLSFDRGLQIATDLKLHFPKHAKQINKIVSSRNFPDVARYSKDPESLRLERCESLGEGVIGQVLLFIVLSDEALTQDKGMVDVNHIIQELELKDGSQDDIYVKRFLFDIK